MTAESVPAVVAKTGIQPGVVIFPDASCNCNVSVVVLLPLAMMEEAALVIVVLATVATASRMVLLGLLLQAPLLTNLL